MRTKKTSQKVRYILARIEKSYLGLRVNDEELTAEHIYPQNANSEWQAIDDLEDIEMLGNLTLLNKKTNNNLGNKNFAEKKIIFAESPLKITNQIALYENWGSDEIEKRQKWLAEQAAKCWKIEF